MSLADLTDPDAVVEAMAEYDRIGQQPFRDKYGFGMALKYVVVVDGKQYDSKAIVGAAHGYQHPQLGPLPNTAFSGGKPTTDKLTSLGFEVREVQQADRASSAVFCVYVPQPGLANLRIGLAGGIWGWKDTAAEYTVSVGSSPPEPGLEIIQSIPVGARFLLAAGGPNPRVPSEEWADATVEEAYLCEVTAGYFYDESVVWPDETYPHRIRFTVIDEATDVVGPEVVGPANILALHDSALRRGLPIPGDGFVPLSGELPPLVPGQTEDPAMLLVEETDAVALVKVRLEQRKLRAHLFASEPESDCAICGRTLPVDTLRAAHIKKRSVCDDTERADLANVMRACTLGCDHLFELGYIHVDPGGLIRRTVGRETSADMLAAISALEERTCAAFGPDSEAYFGWHRGGSTA